MSSGAAADGKNQVPGRLRRFATIVRPAVPPAIVVLTLLIAWEVAARTGALPELVFPTPTEVVASLWNDSALYWDHAQVTLQEIGLGLVIGIVIGVLLGVAIAMSGLIRTSLYPLVVGSQSLPILALAPILVLWLGFGILPKIVIVVQIVFFPITIATVQGLSTVSPEALVFGRSLGAGPWALFWKVRMPAMLPYFFGGLKIAVSYAAIAAVIAEWMGAEFGLGALMIRANGNYQTDVLFGSVAVITAIGLTLFALASIAERKVVPWHRRAPTKR